ncbi:DUF421 domain-containing protein [Hymenobacter rubripertinctus]|uniref:DUF421 domain-containing protein n=1 Tax=Hymenobacter rubripertinctus TaxID=2029981 RepID=A0A418QV33_9BACT|nr:YetF domain-containing protein [Hymenobacter rubripertinctus]RIY09069.1 DUF421 domain-containing protein [Hymenobacter rubripertinctus]
MEQVFFTSWASLIRTLIIGVLAYASLIAMLRVSGKRTLSKMNAFDLIVTVALGSTLATVLLSKSVALIDGLLAFGLLIGLQYGITWLSVRSTAVSRLVKAEPTLLVYQGRFLHEVMRAERITEGEILASLRERGIASLTEAAAVVLENDGTLNALQQTSDNANSALRNVPRP